MKNFAHSDFSSIYPENRMPEAGEASVYTPNGPITALGVSVTGMYLRKICPGHGPAILQLGYRMKRHPQQNCFMDLVPPNQNYDNGIFQQSEIL